MKPLHEARLVDGVLLAYEGETDRDWQLDLPPPFVVIGGGRRRVAVAGAISEHGRFMIDQTSGN